jgi:peptidoglycan/LPS O-acetylase OafA/YrhL
VPVILCHARLSCPGGFIGVDVFFVISGYLITKIILAELGAGSFSLTGFYARRIRRIFPALFLLLAAASAAAYLLLLPYEMIAFGQSLIASAAFVSNVFFSGEIGYFDITAAQKPLLHLWSLAVEEQFYIFWPLILLACHKNAGGKGAFFFCALLVCISLLHSEYLVHHARRAAFFLMPARAWELGTGALLAMGAGLGLLRHIPRRAADWASLAGIVLIATAIVSYDGFTTFPGKAALLPCLGAALIIAAGAQQTTLGGRLLALPPFALIGRISYSLYLWHWPILVFAQIYLGRELQWEEKCWALLLTAFAAYLSWRFVEEPFRRIPVAARSARAFAGGGAAAGLAFACAGWGMVSYDGFPHRIEAANSEIAKVRADHAAFARLPCLMWDANVPPVAGCLVGQQSTEGNYDVVLWGDSHSAQFAPVLDALGKRLNFTARVISKAGCGPLPGMQFTQEAITIKACPEFNASVLQTVLNHSPGIVVLACRWDVYATGAWLVAESSSARPSVAESLNTFISTLRNTIRTLTQAGHRVVIVGLVPVPTGDSVNCIQRIQLTGRDASECAATSASRAETDSKVNALLQLAAGSLPNVAIVYPFERYCNAQACPILTADGRFVYMDGSHLSPAGASLLGADLEAQIASLLRQRQAAIR